MTAPLSTQGYSSSIRRARSVRYLGARDQPQMRSLADKTAEEDASAVHPDPVPLQMLDQQVRIGGFEEAINHVVKPGMKVLELGAGTGALVLAARAARRGLQRRAAAPRGEARAPSSPRTLRRAPSRSSTAMHRPTAPEPVDVVICEMLHTAMLREKQLIVIESLSSATSSASPVRSRFIPRPRSWRYSRS